MGLKSSPGTMVCFLKYEYLYSCLKPISKRLQHISLSAWYSDPMSAGPMHGSVVLLAAPLVAFLSNKTQSAMAFHKFVSFIIIVLMLYQHTLFTFRWKVPDWYYISWTEAHLRYEIVVLNTSLTYRQFSLYLFKMIRETHPIPSPLSLDENTLIGWAIYSRKKLCVILQEILVG